MSSLRISRRKFNLLAAAAGCIPWIGCDDETGGDGARPPAALPPLESAQDTTERTVVPSHEVVSPYDPRDPMVPEDRESLLADGFGEYTFGPGEPLIDRTPGGEPAPEPGPNAHRLARFVHATDLHLTDDEAPSRLAAFDGPPPIDAAARPQAAYEGRVLNAAVRTVNALNRADPIDFFLLGGDSTDSALNTEYTWLVSILSGAESVRCDSGAIDDPVAGPDNDPKDPFTAEGLDIPWYFCMGNHDALIMGVGPITDEAIAEATGDRCVGGARDWSQPGGPVEDGDWIADPARRPLRRSEALALIESDGDGHGLVDRADPDKATYTVDIEGTDLRLLVYDTASETGGADGLVRRSDLEGLIIPALDQALADEKWVILACHHPLASIGEGFMADDQARAEAVPPDEVRQTFLSYPNVILSITGHTHRHAIRWIGDDAGGGFWEVETASLIEYPSQLRLVQIHDEDNGYLAIELIGLDFATDGDGVAELGRRLELLDHTSGWASGDAGTPEDRNVRLHVPVSRFGAD